jgi:hypothetical protein
MPQEVVDFGKASYGLVTAQWFPYVLAGAAVLLGLWHRRDAIKAKAVQAYSFVVGKAVGATVPKLNATHILLLLAVLSWAAQRDWNLPNIQFPPTVVSPSPTEPATSATYVYEKDSTSIPAEVLAGLNRLNREKKLIATPFEEDTLDGAGQTPDQYKVPLAAAQSAGLPALVVTSGEKVLAVVKDPKTEAQVMEAVQ